MADMVGMQVGRYTLDEQIGKGGMARVFRAHETASPDVIVALKVGHNTFSRSDQYERRFAREIEMIVRLDHPNIVPIITFGQDKELLYMAMPYIAGGTLGHRVDEGLLFTPYQAAQMVTQIGSALDYAHSMGMIHRDVKPENIMILDEDNYALADFGLAKLPMTSSTDITAEGSVLGSPPYMSPEQINGDLVDGRADIYALGITLYRILLGTYPFRARRSLSVIQGHLYAQPPRPRTINPYFPEVIEPVLLKTLEKDPDLRYQSAGAFAEALQATVSSVGEAAKQTYPAQHLPDLLDDPSETRLVD